MINIVFSSDDNYVPQLLTSLCSLLVNNHNLSLNIYILDNKISTNNKDRLKNTAIKYNQSITFISLRSLDSIFDSYSSNDLNNLPLSAYPRLFLGKLLPDIYTSTVIP